MSIFNAVWFERQEDYSGDLRRQGKRILLETEVIFLCPTLELSGWSNSWDLYILNLTSKRNFYLWYLHRDWLWLVVIYHFMFVCPESELNARIDHVRSTSKWVIVLFSSGLLKELSLPSVVTLLQTSSKIPFYSYSNLPFTLKKENVL